MSFSLLRRLFPNEHEWTEGNLSAYIDDELDKKTKSRVERHLQTCAACREELATLRQTAKLLALMPEVPLPRSFLVPIQATQPAPRRAPAFAILRTASAMATVLFAVVLSGNLLLRAGYGTSLVPMGSQTESAQEIVITAEKEVAPDTAAPERAMPEAAVERQDAPTMPSQDTISMMKAVEPSVDSAAGTKDKGPGATPMFSKEMPQITAKGLPAPSREAPAENIETEKEMVRNLAAEKPEPPPDAERIVVEQRSESPTEPARVAAVEATRSQGNDVEKEARQSQETSARSRLQVILDGLLWALLLSTVGLWAVTAMLSKRHR